MGKRISDRERFLAYIMGANEQQLRDALETVRVALSTRFPTKRTTTKKDNKADKKVVEDAAKAGPLS